MTPKLVEAATASFDKQRWSYPVEFEWKAVECDTDSEDYKKCEVFRFSKFKTKVAILVWSNPWLRRQFSAEFLVYFEWKAVADTK